VGKKNQNGHENGPLKTRPKNKKGNLFDQKHCIGFFPEIIKLFFVISHG
jgi:hypothetical protein